MALWATLARVRSSELGIPAGSREGPTGTASKDLKDGRVLILARKEARRPRFANEYGRATAETKCKLLFGPAK